jgi:uncharacterized membrane protein
VADRALGVRPFAHGFRLAHDAEARQHLNMTKPKKILLWLMAANYVFVGFLHLLNPAPFVAIIPAGLPGPDWLVLISGLFEITLGVFILEPRVRVFAAWGIIALLIAVFPANVYTAMNNIGLPSGEPGTGNAVFNWIRLPFQALFIAWAWWYTLDDDAKTL